MLTVTNCLLHSKCPLSIESNAIWSQSSTSLFQKAMIKIFEPILHHVVIYIDDVLLFSKDHDSHQDLLSHVLKIVDSHGIMLSNKKSILGQDSVGFFSMVIKDGHFRPGPHIAQELVNFPDEHLSRKQIQ